MLVLETDGGDGGDGGTGGTVSILLSKPSDFALLLGAIKEVDSVKDIVMCNSRNRRMDVTMEAA